MCFRPPTVRLMPVIVLPLVLLLPVLVLVPELVPELVPVLVLELALVQVLVLVPVLLLVPLLVQCPCRRPSLRCTDLSERCTSLRLTLPQPTCTACPVAGWMFLRCVAMRWTS